MQWIDSPTVAKAKAQLTHVIRALRTDGEVANDAMANHLQELLDGMLDWYSTKESLYRVGQQCDAKILGDRFVNGFSLEDWMNEVVELGNECAIAFNELDRSRPHGEYR